MRLVDNDALPISQVHTCKVLLIRFSDGRLATVSGYWHYRADERHGKLPPR